MKIKDTIISSCLALGTLFSVLAFAVELPRASGCAALVGTWIGDVTWEEQATKRQVPYILKITNVVPYSAEDNMFSVQGSLNGRSNMSEQSMCWAANSSGKVMKITSVAILDYGSKDKDFSDSQMLNVGPSDLDAADFPQSMKITGKVGIHGRVEGLLKKQQ